MKHIIYVLQRSNHIDSIYSLLLAQSFLTVLSATLNFAFLEYYACHFMLSGHKIPNLVFYRSLHFSVHCQILPLTFLSLSLPLPIIPLLHPLSTSVLFLTIHPAVLGCSQKKSGSSSDDSDCDISPWLSSAPSPSGPSPSHSHTHEASAHTTVVVGKRSIQLHDYDDAGMF